MPLILVVDIPSVTPCSHAFYPNFIFFNSQTLLYLAVYLRTLALTFPSLTYSSVVRGLKLLVGPELLTIEPSFTKRHTLTYLTNWSEMYIFI